MAEVTKGYQINFTGNSIQLWGSPASQRILRNVLRVVIDEIPDLSDINVYEIGLIPQGGVDKKASTEVVPVTPNGFTRRVTTFEEIGNG